MGKRNATGDIVSLWLLATEIYESLKSSNGILDIKQSQLTEIRESIKQATHLPLQYKGQALMALDEEPEEESPKEENG